MNYKKIAEDLFKMVDNANGWKCLDCPARRGCDSLSFRKELCSDIILNHYKKEQVKEKEFCSICLNAWPFDDLIYCDICDNVSCSECRCDIGDNCPVCGVY